MKNRKRLLSALLAISMAASVPVCASAADGAEKVEGVTLTFVTSTGWVNQGSNIDDELNARFEEETGIKIDMQCLPDDQYTTVLKTKLSTGEVPDIFMVNGGVGAQKFLPEKYFADLSDEEWVSRYVDYAKEGTTIDGKIMGLMRWCVDGWGILYNEDLYNELGLSVPTTQEEFLNVCEVLKENGYTPIYEAGKETWHWAIWLSNYGPYAATQHEGLYEQLNNNTAKFADVPEFEEFLNQLKDLYDKGYLGENALANTWDATWGMMGEGKAGNIVVYQNYQNEIAEKYPDSNAENWGMYPIPLAGNNVFSHSAGGNMMVAYKDSENLEYVKQYFNFLTREDNLKDFYAGRTQLQANPSFVDVEGQPSAAAVAMEENCPGGSGIDLEFGVAYWDNTQIGSYIQEMLLGSKTAKEVLEAIDADRQKMFDAQE